MRFPVCKIRVLIQEKPNGRICSSQDRQSKCSRRWQDAHLPVQRSADAQVQRYKGLHSLAESFTGLLLMAQRTAPCSYFNGYHWLHFVVPWSHNRIESKQSSAFCATQGLQISTKLYWRSPSFNYSHFLRPFPVATSPSEDMVIRTLLRVSSVIKHRFVWQQDDGNF